MASLSSNRLRRLLLDTGINLLTDTIKVMLTTAAYVPDKDHSFASQVTNELSGTGYAGGFGGSGRKALAAKTVTQDDAGDVAYFDAADLTWSAISAGTV